MSQRMFVIKSIVFVPLMVAVVGYIGFMSCWQIMFLMARYRFLSQKVGSAPFSGAAL